MFVFKIFIKICMALAPNFIWTLYISPLGYTGLIWVTTACDMFPFTCGKSPGTHVLRFTPFLQCASSVHAQDMYNSTIYQPTSYLTSTSPVRSLYLSLITGKAGFSVTVCDLSLNAGSGADGVRVISLSPRLRLLL